MRFTTSNQNLARVRHIFDEHGESVASFPNTPNGGRAYALMIAAISQAGDSLFDSDHRRFVGDNVHHLDAG